MEEYSVVHVMVDLETMGNHTKQDAPILSIGAVLFCLRTMSGDGSYKPGQILRQFHCGVNLESCIQVGLVPDGETIEWWLSQSKEAQERVLKVSPSYVIKSALYHFRDHFNNIEFEKLYMWSQGSNFDLEILKRAYYKIGSRAWWKYSNVRDTRTLFDLAGYQYKSKGGHDALEDAKNQALAVIEAYAKLKGYSNEGG